MEAVVVLLVKKIGVALGEEALNLASSKLDKEVSLLTEVHGTMRRIKTEFIVMKAFLSQVDAQRDKNSTVEAWLEQVRKVAFHVEDIIDEYSYRLGEQYTSGFRGSLYNKIHQSKNALAWHRIASQLKQVEADLQQVSDMRIRYDIKTTEGSSYSSERAIHRADSSYSIDDDELVGFGKEREKLIQWLTDVKKSRSIISIWGMGGLGKTTLVTIAYKSQQIKKHFHCHAWVSVSQNYGTEDMLRQILVQFFGRKKAMAHGVDTMVRRSLVETLQNYLHEKKYLIIIDDVWSTDAWFNIYGALPDNKCGGRVVITTRIKDVALLASEGHVLELERLQEEEAWKLFCRKAFWRHEDRKCPQELQLLAEKIVEKCQGLPLAIVAIGSLLSRREMNETEWGKVHENLKWELTDNPYLKVRQTLNLSFRYLPDYLKNCILYCSIFPEDYVIRRKRLIRLWIAEGFIEEKGEKTLEEVAEEYLNELIHRCMLQVVERNDAGRVQSCRMHDLVHELNLSTSKAKRFCAALDGKDVQGVGNDTRRLSVQKCTADLQSISGMSRLRSFFAFDTDISTLALNTVISRFQLLRVLDLQDVPIDRVPDEVANLFNLHYMGLRNTKVKELPKSLGKLRNLQTLDLACSNVERLPHGITELKKLRNLVVEKIHDPTAKTFHDITGIQAPKGIWELKSLWDLQSIEANAEFVRRVGNLTQLRSLRITKLRHSQCAELCSSISKMNFLHKLSIVAWDEAEALEFETLNHPPCLLKLSLKGHLAKGLESPFFHAVGSTLSHLYLGWSGLTEDSLSSLSRMSNLAVLCLDKAYVGTELHFCMGWFPKLKTLSLAYMDELQWLTIQPTAIQNLVRLELIHLRSMKTWPGGIDLLRALQQVDLLEMPKEFMDVVLQIRKHIRLHDIPSITHLFTRDGEWVTESL